MNLLDALTGYVAARRSDLDAPSLDWPDDREQLWILLAEAETIRQAASHMEADIRKAMADRLVENETVRFGDRFYKTSPRRTTRILDPDAFADWLGEDWQSVVPFSESVGDKLKVTGWRAVCERRGVEFSTVRDTFTETTWGDPALQEIPISRAPKYALALKHGESTFGRKS